MGQEYILKEVCNYLQNKHTFILGVKLLCNHYDLKFTNDGDNERTFSVRIIKFASVDQYISIKKYLRDFKNRNYRVLTFDIDSFMIILLSHETSYT